MQTQRIELGLLRASAQPRPLQTADVDKLAASIAEIGLIQPVTVRPAIVQGNVAKDGYQVVAGHHRVAAARALGWTHIDAIVVQAEGHLEAELIEIDENLCRSELSAAQRSHYIARRAEIREALTPSAPTEWQEEDEGDLEVGTKFPPQVSSHGGARPQKKAFAAETSALTGESKRNINQYRAIGDALGEDALRVTGTTLDKKVELMALAKLPEPERKELIERAVAGEVVTARPTPTEAPTPAPTEAPTEAPTAGPLDDLDDTDDAQYVVKEMRLLLTRLRSGMDCDTDADLIGKTRNAIASAPKSVQAKYTQARAVLLDLLAEVAA